MKLFLTCSIICFYRLIDAANLPKQFEKCSLSSNNLDDCLGKSIQKVLRESAGKGIPEFGVPSLDPIFIPTLEIVTGGQAVKVNQKYYNSNLTGFGSSTVNKAHYDQKNKIITYSVNSNFVFTSDYIVDGKILLVPVFGNGKSKLPLDNLTLANVLELEEVERNGKLYLNVKSLKLAMTASRVHYGYENLFNGNKELADNILKILDDNWEIVFEEAKGGFEEGLSLIFAEYIQRILSKVPVDQLFDK